MNDTTHAVDRYLDDLARMLTTLPPADRADALGSVREHVDDSLADLGRPATPEDVTAILGRLGSPATVAAALLDDAGPAPAPAYAAPPTSATPHPAPAAAEPLPGDGDATVALVLSILALLVPFVGLVAAIAAIALARRANRRGTRRDGVRTAGLALGIVALVGQLLIIAGLISFIDMRTNGPWTDSGTIAVERVVPAP